MKKSPIAAAALAIALLSACGPTGKSAPKSGSDLEPSGLRSGWVEDPEPAPLASRGTAAHCPPEFNRLVVPEAERDNPHYMTADQWWAYWEARWKTAESQTEKEFPREAIETCVSCLKDNDYAKCQRCRNFEETERWYRCSVTLDNRRVRDRLGAGVMFCGETTGFDDGCGKLRWKDGPGE